MISLRLGRRAVCLLVREAERNSLMKAAIRNTFPPRAILFFLVALGLPGVVRTATLEDSAKELARKIAEALPPAGSVSCEVRNLSTLPPGDAARVEQALKAELRELGANLTGNGAETTVLVTLSENFKNLAWTAEIRKGDASQVVLLAVERPLGNPTVSGAMPVTIHSEKFWEGPERILDAGEISIGAGKSWLALLFPDGLRIQGQQTGLTDTFEISSNQSASRDPWGNLSLQLGGNIIGVFLAPQICTVNLEARESLGCSPTQVLNDGIGVGHPVFFDIAPAGPPPSGKGTEVEMTSVCGGSNQFLATGAGDYTQTDSLQVFQVESTVAAAVSAELQFPGPITALHAGPFVQGAPRAVVRNLKTGNYEAYRLSFSCAQ